MRKTGYVYFMLDREAGAVKIGYSNRPERRLECLQTGNPHCLEIVHKIYSDRRQEAKYQRRFAGLRLQGEWYKLAGDLKEFLEDEEPSSVLDTEECAELMVNRYFRKLKDGDYEFRFGKHYGETISNVKVSDYGYLEWMIWDSDFDESVKEFMATQI